jgi:outer membrane protein OmpA-like peptidoglycan-associated protein
MKLRSALLGATLLAAPVAAVAQPVDGLYVGLGAGYNYLQDQKVENYGLSQGNALSGPSGTFNTPGEKLTGNGGPIVVGSIGYGLGNGFRIEVQGDWRAQHDRLDSGQGRRDGGADLQTYGGFLNGFYDFSLGLPVFPYVGVGVGYEETYGQPFSYYRRGSGSADFVNTYNFEKNDQGSIAAQGILGFSYPLSAVPGLSVTAEYRFMYVSDEETFRGSFTNNAGSVPAFTKIGSQFNHAGLIGLRYAFNVPQPPPPAPVVAAPPQPAPSRTYLVFFDWDRADLTEQARRIIHEAAANAARVQVTRIDVNGYTDLSGTVAYNQKLSVRRAEAVAAELVRDGVPRSEIVARGFGESDPLVPTAQGVREPQNRRVEIILK